MHKSTPILLSVTILVIASLACALPSLSVAPTATLDQNFWNTAVAETVAAAVSQSQVPASPAPIILGTATPTAIVPPGMPTLSPTSTSTPIPLFTSTPGIPLVNVSVDTNCRVGPGKIYNRVGGLRVGEVAEVYGRNDQMNYWYVRLPGGAQCWLWGEFATLSGNFAALPVYTPPPTPTPMPDFEADYSGTETCSGWWVDIDLDNTGGITFKSVSLTVRDTVTDVVVALYTDGFTDKDGCLDTTIKDNLNPGATRTVSSAPFDYDPDGHKLRATITLCSGVGQSGTCVTKAIEFKP